MLPRRWKTPALALVSLLAALAAAPARGADEAKKPEQDKEKEKVNPYTQAVPGATADSKAKVYTNEDLKKLFGGEPVPDEPEATAPGEAAPPPPAAAEGQAATDPLKQLFDRQAKEAEHKQKVAAAEAKVTQMTEKIAELEKRKLAIRNPLLPRPVGPEENTEEWKALGAAERVQRTEDEIKKAHEDLAKAEAELETLRRATP